ncbi:hypothetical protein BKH42_07090 [Helicobacter sp. 13S00482-2]|uniref:4Fe-4S binding protein n=1 Tax=Helicobacter sp. 13S00482-2 TaxID=1476200 RepID=UPI000BA5EE25|nr:4Fe-4S binding protein [Helicobacter sp. 13S00482-2]PAF53210.1 hypothetical protein BKH42_07090 [Helicobacter sp. 13S00482-2]
MHSRRDFFALKKTRAFISLPYVKKNTHTCTKCEGYCVGVCDEGIIFKKEGGIPYLDFTNSGCVFCRKCAFVCQEEKKGVLDPAMEDKIVGKAKIDISSCLAYSKVVCLSCKDICNGFIKFSGMFYPEVLDDCNACGLCVSVCPQGAISIV